MCSDTYTYSTFMNTALLTNPSPLLPSLSIFNPLHKWTTPFYLLGDPFFGDRGANVHHHSSLVGDWLPTPCSLALPLPFQQYPQFMLHVYRDKITTSVTLSDTRYSTLHRDDQIWSEKSHLFFHLGEVQRNCSWYVYIFIYVPTDQNIPECAHNSLCQGYLLHTPLLCCKAAGTGSDWLKIPEPESADSVCYVGKPRRGMLRRAVFSDFQRKGLEKRFQLQKYISKPDRKKLAEKLGLKDSQVGIQRLPSRDTRTPK